MIDCGVQTVATIHANATSFLGKRVSSISYLPVAIKRPENVHIRVLPSSSKVCQTCARNMHVLDVCVRALAQSIAYTCSQLSMIAKRFCVFEWLCTCVR
jgi:hypothetical protein